MGEHRTFREHEVMGHRSASQGLEQSFPVVSNGDIKELKTHGPLDTGSEHPRRADM